MDSTIPGLTATVTSITPRNPTWWERIIRFFTGGPTMPDPTGLTASFDKTSYAPGEPMTLSVGATAGIDAEPVTATVTFFRTSDPSTPVGTVQASTSVGEPDQLGSSATDTMGHTYTPGPASQNGTAYTAEFTAPA